MAKKSWTVAPDGVSHTVEFEHGYWSGRKSVWVDGVEVARGRTLVPVPFEPDDLPFTLAGHAGIVRTVGNGFTFRYDLGVDGVSAGTGQRLPMLPPLPRWFWLFIVPGALLAKLGGLIGILLGAGNVVGCRKLARTEGVGSLGRFVLCGMLTGICWGGYVILAVVIALGAAGFPLFYHPPSAQAFTPMPLSALHGTGQVYFAPLDRFPAGWIDDLTAYYAGKYGLNVHVLPPVAVPDSARDPHRQQLVAENAIALLQQTFPDLARRPDAVVVGLTMDDMYIRAYSNWRFAFTDRAGGHFAVVATGRMRIGVTSPTSLVPETRLRKMVTKDIGILYYHLPQSDNPRSVLYDNIGGIEELDAMGEDF